MANDKWNVQYEQLNQRSRWYSSQLWYVPFAYVGLVGLGIEKIQRLPDPLDNLAYLMLSIFSVAVYIHVVSLKFYERRAVLGMQNMEDPVVSGGSGRWYMSFVTYIKLMLVVGSYSFVWFAAKDLDLYIKGAGISIITIVFVTVWWTDKQRTRPIHTKIRNNMSSCDSDTQK